MMRVKLRWSVDWNEDDEEGLGFDEGGYGNVHKLGHLVVRDV